MRPFRSLALATSLAGLFSFAQAETLPLTEGLIALDSVEGERLLFEAEAIDDYFPLSLHFVTQDNPAFCGPASIAMVLNAIGVERPISDATAGFGLFDQDNIFNVETDAVNPREEVERGGMTLDELAGFFDAHGLVVGIHHAGDSSLDEFRRLAIEDVGTRDGFVLVNYLRSALGQETGGHISPLAAYDADTDRFLILDVSRYKYPPIWVEAAILFNAMNTEDSDNANRTRGYLFVSQ